jgi:hypothetical protein
MGARKPLKAGGGVVRCIASEAMAAYVRRISSAE